MMRSGARHRSPVGPSRRRIRRQRRVTLGLAIVAAGGASMWIVAHRERLGTVSLSMALLLLGFYRIAVRVTTRPLAGRLTTPSSAARSPGQSVTDASPSQMPEQGCDKASGSGSASRTSLRRRYDD